LAPPAFALRASAGKPKPRIVTYVAFSDDAKAIAFERYLKTASGRAFANKLQFGGSRRGEATRGTFRALAAL
jgi:hypothetical protein